MRAYQPKCVDDDFAFDGLDGVDDDGDGARVELFEGLGNATRGLGLRITALKKAKPHLLRVDIDAGKPASETRVRMVPADDSFGPKKDQNGTRIRIRM